MFGWRVENIAIEQRLLDAPRSKAVHTYRIIEGRAWFELPVIWY